MKPPADTPTAGELREVQAIERFVQRAAHRFQIAPNDRRQGQADARRVFVHRPA
jgi:hypothetical protein